MSYKMNGYGAYYEYQTHEVFSGYGATDTANIRKNFDPVKVWADAQLGGSCYTPGNPNYENEAMYGMCNAAGARASDAIRKGLVELGYADDLTLGVMWGGADKAAWEAFTSDQSLPAGPGLVNKIGIDRMGELLRQGKSPGPSKAGMGKLGWLLVAGAVAVGAVALVAGKKRKRGATPTGRAQVPMR